MGKTHIDDVSEIVADIILMKSTKRDSKLYQGEIGDIVSQLGTQLANHTSNPNSLDGKVKNAISAYNTLESLLDKFQLEKMPPRLRGERWSAIAAIVLGYQVTDEMINASRLYDILREKTISGSSEEKDWWQEHVSPDWWEELEEIDEAIRTMNRIISKVKQQEEILQHQIDNILN